MSATLDDFVSSIKSDIIVLVLLEQVVGRHLVAAYKESLKV